MLLKANEIFDSKFTQKPFKSFAHETKRNISLLYFQSATRAYRFIENLHKLCQYSNRQKRDEITQPVTQFLSNGSRCNFRHHSQKYLKYYQKCTNVFQEQYEWPKHRQGEARSFRPKHHQARPTIQPIEQETKTAMHQVKQLLSKRWAKNAKIWVADVSKNS